MRTVTERFAATLLVVVFVGGVIVRAYGLAYFSVGLLTTAIGINAMRLSVVAIRTGAPEHVARWKQQFKQYHPGWIPCLLYTHVATLLICSCCLLGMGAILTIFSLLYMVGFVEPATQS